MAWIGLGIFAIDGALRARRQPATPVAATASKA
jgi:hypothetical protein